MTTENTQSHPIQTDIFNLLPGNSAQIIDFLIAENRILRNKFGKRVPLIDADREELVRKGFPIKKWLGNICSIVKPETILAWNRKMKKDKYNHTDKRNKSPGRPRKSKDTVSLIIRIATENARAGYTRIVGELKKLGHIVSRTTVRNVMIEHGIPPTPKRKGMDWIEFLNAHKPDRLAADFFTEEVWTLGGLVTCYILFFINISTKKVYIAGCTPHPFAAWVAQQAKNFSMWLDDCGMRCKYLIHDHDCSLLELGKVLESQGVKIVKTPIHTPICNCFAERFVREVRETLDNLIIFGERHLFKTVKCIEKYHKNYRPHQGINNTIPAGYDYPETETKPENVKCVQELGGLLKHYYAYNKAA
jgi:hypothetical protein